MQKKTTYRVLLIEDNKIDQMAFTKFIQKENIPYNYVLADSILQAKDILDNQQFDVIITDYLLKDGTGMDILEIVKETPIIFTTGAGNEKLAVKAMKAGAYDYLIKNSSRSYLPILPLIIENAINHVKMVRQVKAYHENLEELVRERTEQLNLEKELLSVTFSSMTDGIIVVDANKNIVLLNNVAEIFIRNKFDYIRGKNVDHIFQLIDERSRKPLENPIDKVLSSGNIQTIPKHGILVIADKSEHPVSISLAPIFKNGTGIVSGAVLLLHDRSQECEIDKIKTEFISSVSHELRTPLTSIKAYTETILRDPKMPEEQKREFLITIDKESNRLAELVNGLLEISKLESGQVEIVTQSINITEVIEQVMLSLKRFADNKNIILVKTISGIIPLLCGHESRIRSLISNLINNAIKFTPNGGTVSINLEHNNDELKIHVSDTGIGIPQNEMSHIFERFYRAHQSGMQIPGTGLGLAIVKEVAAIHGGKVEVESELGKGTTFIVSLPVSKQFEYSSGNTICV